MSKPSDDLSALFRSLRPDESISQENINTSARDAEQRWPLFKAVAPEKPQETPALSAQDRQRWAKQEMADVADRKPALSLPGLSDKMSSGLDKMSMRALKNTVAVKPAMRREPEKFMVERSIDQAVEQTRAVPLVPIPQASTPVNRAPTTANKLSIAPAVGQRSGLGVFDKKPVAPVPARTQVAAERDVPAAGLGDGLLKNIFNRLEAKPEVEVQPAVKRSSFLDRLGKR